MKNKLLRSRIIFKNILKNYSDNVKNIKKILHKSKGSLVELKKIY